MRKTFQMFLLIFVFVAFVITFLTSYYFQTKQSQDNAVSLVQLRVQDAKQQIEINNKNLSTIKEITAQSALAKARAVAQMIVLDKDIVNNLQSLQNIASQIDVEEIYICNADGIVIASTIGQYGYDMASAEQSAAFLEAITNPDFEFVQEPMGRGDNGKLFQFAGVSRIDEPGIVQIGYRPERLQQAMEIADIENLSSGFRIGTNGHLMLCQGNTILSIADKKWLGKSIDEYGISASYLLDESGNFNTVIDGIDYLCYYNKFDSYTIIGALPAEEMYLSRDEMSIYLVLYNLVLFAVVFVLISLLIQKIVINGIYSVNNSLSRITRGNLDEKVDVRTNQEFISLSDGINSTVSALKDAITEAAARINKELEFAKAIQISSLPSVFPAYPNIKEFDIYASMYTAKEVGGDFYDFFLIGSHRIGLVIADVSGKGIPAALFMMTSKTHIKNYMQTEGDLGEKFTIINNHLCENNDTGMFVTVFAAVLNLKTGKITYVNAGHNPPLIKHKNEEYTFIQTKKGFVLGGMKNIRYNTTQSVLKPGDRLFMYTDGITEAANTSDELFGNQRLIDFLNSKNVIDQPPQKLLTSVKKEIDLFTANAEQTDDITMLAVEYKGGVV